jgi:hypothetical protein
MQVQAMDDLRGRKDEFYTFYKEDGYRYSDPKFILELAKGVLEKIERPRNHSVFFATIAPYIKEHEKGKDTKKTAAECIALLKGLEPNWRELPSPEPLQNSDEQLDTQAPLKETEQIAEPELPEPLQTPHKDVARQDTTPTSIASTAAHSSPLGSPRPLSPVHDADEAVVDEEPAAPTELSKDDLTRQFLEGKLGLDAVMEQWPETANRSPSPLNFGEKDLEALEVDAPTSIPEEVFTANLDDSNEHDHALNILSPKPVYPEQKQISLEPLKEDDAVRTAEEVTTVKVRPQKTPKRPLLLKHHKAAFTLSALLMMFPELLHGGEVLTRLTQELGRKNKDEKLKDASLWQKETWKKLYAQARAKAKIRKALLQKHGKKVLATRGLGAALVLATLASAVPSFREKRRAEQTDKVDPKMRAELNDLFNFDPAQN